MSTGQECAIVEYRPDRWYLVLENIGAPKQSWDWREYAAAYGPFSTPEKADEYLSANFANPGGYFEIPYEEGKMESYAKLVAAAKRGRRQPIKGRTGWVW